MVVVVIADAVMTLTVTVSVVARVATGHRRQSEAQQKDVGDRE